MLHSEVAVVVGTEADIVAVPVVAEACMAVVDMGVAPVVVAPVERSVRRPRHYR